MFDKVNFVFSGGGETGYAHHARSFWGALEPMVPPRDGGHDCTIVLGCVNDPDFYRNYSGYKIAYNVWESTLYPDDFFKRLLDFDQLWVPSTWQKNCAVMQGYPPDRVQVVPEGVDGELFRPEPNPKPKQKFDFLLFGKWEDRKATTEIILAFLLAFPEEEYPDVRLILSVDNPFPVDGMKTTKERLNHYSYTDSRIINRGFMSRDEYVRTLRNGQVFVSCSRAEGWNLPLMEAIACGIPSICSDTGAQLDFAQGALKVKIREHRKPERVYNMPDCPGVWAEPDFDDLIDKMKDAYIDYALYRNVAIDVAQSLREKWSWKNAAKIAYEALDELSLKAPLVVVPAVSFSYNFIEGAFVEIKGNTDKLYDVSFRDADRGDEVYALKMKCNSWAKTGKIVNDKNEANYMGPVYYKKWEIVVKDESGVLFNHVFNAKDKRVLVSLDSKSLGDSIAWVPYCEEFRVKHGCKMIVTTWHNHLFKNVYPEIEFVKPGTVVHDLYAMYIIGVFHASLAQRTPRDWRSVPLQRVASDILGLEFREIQPRIDTSEVYISAVKRPKKYVCVSEHSTAMCKYWHYPDGWQILVDALNRQGYNVIAISHEQSGLKNVIHSHGNHINVTMGLLMGCEFYVGVASGLAWLAWALGKQTVMISGFSAPFVEFESNNIRISGEGDCTNCLNDILIQDRAWDEGCFHNQGFSCTRLITPESVLERLPRPPSVNVLDFTTAPIMRYSKRQTGFKKFLSEVHKFDEPQIVEIGTVRRELEDPDLPGDGNSTSVFAWYVKNYKGSLVACDISAANLEACKKTLMKQDLLLGANVLLVEKDGMVLLKESVLDIHGLYIDGFDWGPSEKEKQASIEWHLEAFKLAEPLLVSGAVIMIDDVFDDSYTGKGKLAIPYALEHGYEKIFHEYQVILRKE